MESCASGPRPKGLRCYKGGGRSKASSKESLLVRLRDKIAINKTKREMEKEEKMKSRGYGKSGSFERDMPGDVNPGGFGGGEGKKGSRFTNVAGQGMKYTGSIFDRKRKKSK